MDNLDFRVLHTLRDWRRAGVHGWLVTVVRTWGSSPRPVGSILALSDRGAVVGSVSGGCIEDDLIARCCDPAREDALPPTPGAPMVLKYGISADEAHRFGLPCGGTLELLLERDPALDSLECLVDALAEGCLVRRSVRLSDGAVTLSEASGAQAFHADAQTVAHTFGPQFRMLLIGAGQLAEYLATMAGFNGFAVTVCDPRVEYRDAWSVPSATLAEGMPDDVVLAFRPDRRSAVIALTHDPKLDDLALLEALKTDAFYVGAMGSRRNNGARRQRLAEHFDLGAHELARLRGPIGLFIGSKTPAEIAVSVMAEVLGVRNGVAIPRQMQVAPAKEWLAG